MLFYQIYDISHLNEERGYTFVNKEDILKRVETKKTDEMTEYLDNKATMYGLIFFFILCFLTMISSYFSHFQKELFFIPLCLMSSFLCVFSIVYYYYLKQMRFLIVSCMSAIVLIYTMIQIWILIW